MSKTTSATSKKRIPHYSKRKLRLTLQQCIMDDLQRLGTTRALSLAISFRSNQYSSVDETLLEVIPHMYDCADKLARDLQACAFFKKSTYLKSGRDLDQELYDNFTAIEEVNRRNNILIASRKSFQANGLIYDASRILARILGKAPDVTSFRPIIGTGASFGLASHVATPAHKLEGQPDVTCNAFDLAREFLKDIPELFPCNVVDIVKGNKASSVPNTYKKKRFISTEAILNAILQRNIGIAIRGKLRKVGIDIETQQDFHKFLVTEYWDQVCTIDLSNASDSICYELVKALFYFAPDWFDLLCKSRSEYTLYNGRWFKLEKFCSQGNGFTFELETLIFYCIATAAIKRAGLKQDFVTLFGDDTICFKECGEVVKEAYVLCGFTVNTDKSFTNGLFKESCGVDTFKGINVRPTYIKEFSHGAFGFYELHNRMFDASVRSSSIEAATRYPSNAVKRIRAVILQKHLCGGPVDLGDSVLHGVPWVTRTFKGITAIKALTARYRESDYHLPSGEAILPYALLGYDSRGVLTRGAHRIPLFKKVFLHSRLVRYVV